MKNKMDDVVQKIMDIITSELKEEKELLAAKQALTEFMKMSSNNREPNIYMVNAIEAARKSLADINSKPTLGADGINKLMKLYVLLKSGLGSNSMAVEEKKGIEISDEMEENPSDEEDNRQVRITWLTEDGVPDYRYFACANGKILQYMDFTLKEKFPRKRRKHTNSGEIISSEVIVNLTPDKAYFVSHLIWEAFNPDFRNEEYELIHKDGDLRNCALSNLDVAYEDED